MNRWVTWFKAYWRAALMILLVVGASVCFAFATKLRTEYKNVYDVANEIKKYSATKFTLTEEDKRLYTASWDAEESARIKLKVSIVLYSMGAAMLFPVIVYWMIAFLMHVNRPMKTHRDRILEIAQGIAHVKV